MKLLRSIIFIVTAWAAGYTGAYAQAPDSVALAAIGDQLVQLALKEGEGVAAPGDNCLRDTEGHFLSCFSASSSPAWVTDFNGDGVPDAVFSFSDEGLGGGGNAYGYEFRVVLLDHKYKIIGQQTIFGGGKFSYGQLEIDKVSQGKIYATYSENPMSRDYGEEGKELESVSLVFAFRQGKIVEEGYTRCPLAALKKQIFKKDNGLQITSGSDMDSQFNEEWGERVRMPDSSEFMASLSGCEDLELYFSRTVTYRQALETNKTAMKQELLDNLGFLKENTLFKTVISNAYTQLSTWSPGRIPTDKNGGTALHLQLSDGWKAHLFLSGNKEQGSFITLRFEKPKSTAPMDFWESMNSKQRLK